MYHPTTAIFIEESGSFLENIVLQLDPFLPVKIFNNPKNALKYLENNKPGNDILSEVIETNSDNFSELKKYSINYKLSPLYREIYNKKRFDRVSIVIVDYPTQETDGIEFCKKLAYFPIKKIMLAEVTNYDLVIQAFNEGIIDKFIRKDQPNLSTIINESIYELQKTYFQEISNLIFKLLSFEETTCFNDPAYCSLFNEICLNNEISDYYLIDLSGSFLLIGINGTPTWFLIKSEDELKEYIDCAKDTKAHENVIKSLERGEKIPYFSNFSDYMCALNGSWERYLHNAFHLKGEKNYFYSIIKELPYFELKKTEIFSSSSDISDRNKASSLVAK